MIAEVCRFFHWTMEYCLEMPAIQFFKMLEQARQMRALERMEECDIASIPMGNEKHYANVRRRYEKSLEKVKNEVSDMKKKPHNRPVLDSGNPNTFYAMRDIFKTRRH
jgi:valyl-tRNA synthetase